jgi:uncharacterized membrane protein (DUF485 family)
MIFCVLFTLIIISAQYKNPVSQIMSYPPAIRKRVETLPEYQNTIKHDEKKQIFKKLCAVFLLVIILAFISYVSGARTFLSAFIHTFILFTVVNLYDLVVLDIIVFCHSKWVIIKGTEDMIDEYKNPGHHIIGFCKGIGIGIVVALLSGGMVELYNMIK